MTTSYVLENDVQAEEFSKLTGVLSKHELVQGYRRFNLRHLVAKHGGQTELSKELGYVTSTYLTQMVGPSPIRGISEKNAREFEVKLGLPEFTLDRSVMFSVSDLELKRQIELTGGVVDKETVEELNSLGLEPTPDMARKYSKIDYSVYRNPRYLENSPVEKPVLRDVIGFTATPLLHESHRAVAVPPTAPTIGESALLELVELIESSELSSGKALKVLKMSIKDMFKKQTLDREFVANLIELSK